jgi:hypothetical protein
VCYVLSNFAWAMPSPWTNFDLRDMVRFPHFAWFAPSALGNLSARRFKGELVSSLVRSTLRGSAEHDFRNPFLSNVWAMTLGHWIVIQQHRLFMNYSVSPLGTIHDVNPEDEDWYSDLSKSCNRRIESCIQSISPHSEHLAHELDVLSMVLVRIHQTAFRIRNHNGIITEEAEAPDTMMTTARMRLYKQVFDACMREIEMSIAEVRDGTAAPERHEEIRYMSAHLGRLTAAGMWDRKWRALHDARHYLLPGYTDTGRYWCTCGKQVSRKLDYLLRWRIRREQGSQSGV